MFSVPSGHSIITGVGEALRINLIIGTLYLYKPLGQRIITNYDPSVWMILQHTSESF